MNNKKSAFIIGLLLLAAYAKLALAFGQTYNPYYGEEQGWFPLILESLKENAIVGACGAFIGLFLSHVMRGFRKFLFILGAIALFFYFDTLRDVFAFFAGMVLFLYLGRDKTPQDVKEAEEQKKKKNETFGSAEWATLEHLNENGHINKGGLFLGDFERLETQTIISNLETEKSSFLARFFLFFSPKKADRLEQKKLIFVKHPITYQGDRHLLTVAPTRSGKGISSIIPNILTYLGSMLIIDPKGENARITAKRRGAGGLGQIVHVVDPWGITGEKSACFNPLDWLSPDDENISENAMMLADSIVTQHQGTADPFWNEEAKALLMGIILYVALDPKEQDRKNLGRVRDIIVSDNQTLKDILIQMTGNTNPIVYSTATRTASKDAKLLASVLASLQSHTHFLDSPRIRQNLSRSDFKFEDLKTGKTTIYLVLPADRLETFGRWLRLLVQQAITVNARNIDVKPEKPILFLLDEMAALGRLTMVEQAYGLMAGFGMQLWGIVQDLSQLERIYDTGWETFIGNSGVLQYFGSRDQKTAEYFSKLCGVSTVEKISFGNAIAHGIGYVSSFAGAGNSSSRSSSNNTTFSTNLDVVQRQLAYPDELMVMRDGKQILFIENANPIQGKKIKWFDDIRFKQYGRSLNG